MHECLTGTETGLIAYYNAQHASTTVAEDITTNYNGTINGTVGVANNISPELICCEPKCQGSFKFTGTNGEMIALPTDHALYNITGFTWEAWIKPAGIPTGIDTLPNASKGQVIISAADGTNCADIGLAFGWSNATEHRLVFAVDGAGCVRDPNSPSYVGFQNNQWYHVAAVADYAGGTAKLFVNGNLVSSSNYFGVTSSYQPFSTLVSVQIGNLDYGNKTFPFNGLIDEVRIWNTVRTPNQISSNKDACLTGTETGLVAYYKATEQNTDTAFDETNIYHGELSALLARDNENAPLVCCGGTVGIEQLVENTLSVYPNPVSGVLHIRLTDVTNTLVSVYNTVGGLMKRTILTSNTIDVSSFSSGIYIMELFQNNRLSRVKFVVE
jgi:hypothetical protein